MLPSTAAPGRFVSESAPSLVRSLLGAWPLAEQQRFFERDLGIPLALEDGSGKLFPASNRARDVRDGLVRPGAHVRGRAAIRQRRHRGGAARRDVAWCARRTASWRARA